MDQRAEGESLAVEDLLASETLLASEDPLAHGGPLFHEDPLAGAGLLADVLPEDVLMAAQALYLKQWLPLHNRGCSETTFLTWRYIHILFSFASPHSS